MRNKKIIIFLISFTMAGTSLLGQEREQITFHVHLFRGEQMREQRGHEDIVIMAPSSQPAIEALQQKLDAARSELTAAAIDVLLTTQDLRTVDEYFYFQEKWAGRIGIFSSFIEHSLYRFKFVYAPRLLSPQRIELTLSLFKSPRTPIQFSGLVVDKLPGSSKSTKATGRLDKLLDVRLQLDLDSPVIIVIPAGEETYFMMLYARREMERQGGLPGEKTGAKKEALVEAPKALRTLIPAYPTELRQQGVVGRVGLMVKVDEKGAVAQVAVTKPLHPYLDFAAVQAVRQWTYAPATQKGRAIPVVLNFFVNFDPETYRQIEEKAMAEAEKGEAGQSSPGEVISDILEKTAEYCQKLSAASFDFICEETIQETHYNFAGDPRWSVLTLMGPQHEIVKRIWFPEWDPGRTQRNFYLCDYLFVRNGHASAERRIILQENDRKMPDRSRLLEERRFTALNPLLAAVQVLGKDRQSLFYFRLLGKDSIRNRKARVVEAMPKAGNTQGVEYAQFWIDQENFQILRSEIQGIPLEGYDDVLEDCIHFKIRPYLLTTHAYNVEKNGVCFPSKSAIRVEYPRAGEFNKDRTLKLRIDMTYDKYEFFSVETEERIKK